MLSATCTNNSCPLDCWILKSTLESQMPDTVKSVMATVAYKSSS